MKYDAIVIGAGPNGLVAATTLAKHGRKVLVLEAAADVGGHTRTLEFAPGFRAPVSEDCGWVPPIVAGSLGLGDSLRTIVPTQSVIQLEESGGLFALPTDPGSAGNAIRRLSARDAERWPAFVDRLHKFAGILAELYQLAAPDIDTTSVREIIPLIGVGRRMRKLGRHDMTEFLRVMPMSIQDLLDDTFESETLKAAVAACAVRDLRQGPRSGGTTFNLIHYLVGAARGSVRARPMWVDGPGAFARAVAELARAAGATIRCDARVSQVLVRDHEVTGVLLAGGEEIEGRAVLATTDPKRTLLELVDPVWLDPDFALAARNIKLRGATAFVLYALRGRLEHSTQQGFTAPVSLTPTTRELERAADAAKYGALAAEPHVEFFVPSQRWTGLAPENHQVIVARLHYAPYALRGEGWTQEQREQVERAATGAIGRVIPGFEGMLVAREVVTPPDVEAEFGVTEGALTHGELTLDQILFMRPVPGWANHRAPIDGLYLGGSGSHPGPGILGGAGLLAARRVLA